MSTISSEKIIETLRSVFATHRIPQMIVTDNGSSFTSDEFKTFTRKNGIKHVTYHPSSNGQAERAVQTVKKGLKRTPGKTIQERLSKFLFKYRITPHATTEIAPCELLMRRKLRSSLDLLFPAVQQRVEDRQAKQKAQHDGQTPRREFKVSDKVYVENFPSKNPRWIPGTVVKVTGPLSYKVELTNGAHVRRHVDNVRRRDENEREKENSNRESNPPMLLGPQLSSESDTAETPENPSTGEQREPQVSEQNPNPAPRRSNRVRNPPERYGL
jgi:hypothetical protein